ncbi:hypothetical protein CLERM_329 [Coxiella-like endosymbiont]|nr:hypothetical protein CLERM_329 [Coxiella-like endosymbiont]
MIVYAVIVTLDGNLLVPLLFLAVIDLTHVIIFDFISSSFWGGMGERKDFGVCFFCYSL